MPLTQILGGFERKNSRVTIALSNLPKVGHIWVSEIIELRRRKNQGKPTLLRHAFLHAATGFTAAVAAERGRTGGCTRRP